jgi:exopolysaccharide biosynthesis polyprenyl glycosylphosphotransferase
LSVSVTAKPPPSVEDARAARPYLLRRNPLESFARRTLSVLALVVLDVVGLTLGLYAALILRSWLRDPPPIFWNAWWDAEKDWLPFLILVTMLVFWQNGLYRPRELRGGIGRVVQSVALVTALALAFAIGTGQHFQTFGLYVVAPILIAASIALLRWSYEAITSGLLRSYGVRRRVLLVGNEEQVGGLRHSLGSSRGGIDYEFVGHVPAAAAPDALVDDALDELIVADDGMPEDELLELVEFAHRRGVKVRIAPRTTQLLVERGEYVPGQSVVLFDVSPPILAGADWALKRGFDLVVAGLTLVVGLPLWLLIAAAIKLTSRGPVFYADERVGLGEQAFRMLKFRTMVADAEVRRESLEQANEATGALFKIRDDPRVTSVGRFLRRFSIDEVPNVLNVLRGQMSLVGPRPLPLRDNAKLESWHRRRSNVLPGMTGLWQIAGRSDLSFDDLVRLDFYYLENWSLWLDIAILVKTVPAVVSRRGAY